MRRDGIAWTTGIAAGLLASALTLGCGRQDDPIAQAEQRGVAKGVAAPGIAETRAIAEEGFIYGLPIVMNYAVMYEFAVDRGSSQFKAPFNEIKNESNVFTYKDTAVVTPNSDTPYSMAWLDLRAEPMVISVPSIDPKRYYSVQLCDGNTYNYGYIGSRATGSAAGDYMVTGPDWKGTMPAGIKQVFRSSGTRLAPGDRANPQSYKVRRAKVGGWRDYLDDDQVAAIESMLASRPKLPFGYAVMPPTARTA